MRKTNTSQRVALRVVERTSDCLSLATLEQELAAWLQDDRIQSHTPDTIDNHRRGGAKLLWFLSERRLLQCGPAEVRDFFDYLTTGHLEEGGRFREGQLQPLKPATLANYFAILRAFFNRLVELDVLAESPMRKLRRPKVREDQIQPFTAEQVQALMQAARTSRDPVRNEAILLLLYDTGIRASELCSLTLRDVDLLARRLTVTGKGNKVRTLYLGAQARRAMKRLTEEYRDAQNPNQPAELSHPIFCSNRGKTAGAALTRGGLHQVIQTLGVRAGLTSVRCSPHTMRHTFAVSYLRNDGGVFSLQQSLGHENLAMTRRYVALADADLADQHAKASPADKLFGKRRKH